MAPPLFITGNQNKADYLQRLIGLPIEHQKIDLDEIQSTSLDEIVRHKVKQAYAIAGRPVLVEDVALGFDALGGLPGPFIKFFVDTDNGLEKLCRMLDGFSERGAMAESVFGYYDGTRLELLRGGLHGVISDHPRGSGGYGWDKIFSPDGWQGRTRAEATPEEDEATYQIIKPFAALKELLHHLEP